MTIKEDSGKLLETLYKWKQEDYDMSKDVMINDITPSGVDKVEDQSKFKETFGFTVNLGLIQFNWGVQES